MKRKVLIDVILVIMTICLTGCSSIDYSKAQKFLKSGDKSILDITEDQVFQFWRDFCRHAPMVLEKIGITMEDLGFEALIPLK